MAAFAKFLDGPLEGYRIVLGDHVDLWGDIKVKVEDSNGPVVEHTYRADGVPDPEFAVGLRYQRSLEHFPGATRERDMGRST